MKKEIKNVPERIFLVLGDGIFDGSEDFDELSEVTWSKERIYPNDIEFVRKKYDRKDIRNSSSKTECFSC